MLDIDLQSWIYFFAGHSVKVVRPLAVFGIRFLYVYFVSFTGRLLNGLVSTLSCRFVRQ